MMTKCVSIAGTKAEGFTEIRDGGGKLLVSFASKDTETFWGYRYQRERIVYAMRHRRNNIPDYLRTGEPPPHLKVEAIKLMILNLIRR
jgi:hypothetical protein